jgi:hypothetical protein
MIDEKRERIAYDVNTSGFEIHQKYGPGLLLETPLRKIDFFMALWLCAILL